MVRAGIDGGQIARIIALEDSYVRENWFEIDEICKLNGIPFNPTGERIGGNGRWRVFEFTWQMDAILFWNHFQARWLRGSEFYFPDKPADLPQLKLPPAYRFSKPRPERRCLAELRHEI